MTLLCDCDVQQPKLEDSEDDDRDGSDDADDEDATATATGVAGGDWRYDVDAPVPAKARRQTYDGPVLPLDADSTFALPGNVVEALPLLFYDIIIIKTKLASIFPCCKSNHFKTADIKILCPVRGIRCA